MALATDNLNALIEFDSPFTVEPGGVIADTPGVRAPSVERDRDFDYLVDGTCPIDSVWQAFSGGYTGQYGYRGPIMHAAETLSGALAADILATPGVYVVCAVEAPCTPDDPCFPDEPDYCEEYGCDSEPAGWIVLHRDTADN